MKRKERQRKTRSKHLEPRADVGITDDYLDGIQLAIDAAKRGAYQWDQLRAKHGPDYDRWVAVMKERGHLQSAPLATLPIDLMMDFIIRLKSSL